MKVGVFWRKFRNVEQQMRLTPDKVYDDAYEEAHHHYSALKSAGYDACLIEWKKDPRKTLENIIKEDVDIIFNASSLKEVAFLETFGIPYVGSGIDLVPLDKAQRKELVAYNKLDTARFTIADSPDNIPEIKLNYPLFIKPISGRGSAGISEENIIYKEKDIPKVVRKITENIGQKALVKEEIHCPANFTKEEEKRIKEAALNIYKVLNGKDYARVDMIVGKDGIPYFLEINTFAGLTMESKKDESGNMKVHHGYMGYAARAAGMTAPEFIGSILESAIERYGLQDKGKKRLTS